MTSEILLEIENLTCGYQGSKEYERVLTGAGLTVRRGEIIGLSGRSGSGKTTIAMAIMGMLFDMGGEIREGQIVFTCKDGQKVTISQGMEKELEKIRGKEISLVFQNPGLALNPMVKVGKQLKRCCLSEDLASMLESVGLEKEIGLKDKYPHQLSIGMCQRVTIAMAIGSRPALLILDEPTASLDGENKKKIAELLLKINSTWGTGMLIATHDEAFLEEMGCLCYELINGKIVEKQVKNEERTTCGIPTE